MTFAYSVTFTSCLLTFGIAVILLFTSKSSAIKFDRNETVCHYLGAEFHDGELVTGSTCDQCYCTQHGIMCQLMKCPTVNCHDPVMGECCYECPNGPNCLYDGENGRVLVPDAGCTYSAGVVCHCYHDNKLEHDNKEETICWPAFPRDNSPACNKTAK